MYKALFFDVDDTLLNFKLCSRAALSNSFESLNIQYDHSFFDLFYKIDHELWSRQKQGLLSVQDVINSRFKEMFSLLKISVDSNKFKNVFHEKLSAEFILESDALEIIRYFSSKYKLYVASNGFLAMQQSRLRSAGLLSYFTELFVSDDIGYEKPDSRFFDECLNRSKLKNNDILFIGDSLDADMLGAYNSSIDTCWYNPGNKINDRDFKIDYIINDLLQLKEIMDL